MFNSFATSFESMIRAIAGNDFVPLHAPVFTGNEKRYVMDTIDSTFVSSVGQYVTDFEAAIAGYTGIKHAVAVTNGTAALHLSLVGVGVAKGDEVITQALTFVATSNAIAYCQAAPVYIDVDSDTMGLSPTALRSWLVDNASIQNGVCINTVTQAKISACVVMHTFGHPARLDELKQICDEYNIILVEDAAESLGSYYKGQHTGQVGRVAALSFNGNKIITTGGGGMILTNDDELAKRLKHLSTTAKVPHKWDYVHDEIGYNYRMPNLNAALGLAQLETIEQALESKQKLTAYYRSFFDELTPEVSGVELIEQPRDTQSNYWLQTLRFKSHEQQQAFLKQTNEHGIMTRPIWQLNNTLPMFSGCQTDGLMVSNALVQTIVNIPSSIRL